MHLTHLRLVILTVTVVVVLVAQEAESCGGGKKGGWKKEKKEKKDWFKEKKACKVKSVGSSMYPPETPSLRATVGRLVNHHIARHSGPSYDYEVEAAPRRRVARPPEFSYRDPNYRPSSYAPIEDYMPPPGYEERRVLVPVGHTVVAKPKRRKQPVFVPEEDDVYGYHYERPYASRYPRNASGSSRRNELDEGPFHR